MRHPLWITTWFLVSLFLLGSPQALADEPDPGVIDPNLSLETALQAARLHNPVIVGAYAKLNQARLDAQDQENWWARIFKANVNHNLLGSPTGAPVNPDGVALPTAAIGVIVSLSDVLNGPRARLRSREGVTLAEAELRQTINDVLTQVAIAYQNLQIARERQRLAKDAVGVAQADLLVGQRQFANGQNTANTVLGLRLASARASGEQAAANLAVQVNWISLQALLGTTVPSNTP